MLRIPPEILNCSFYTYKTTADANDGSQTGGSGCLISVPSVHQGWSHLYAVTNKHLIDRGYRVLRLNTTDGKTGTIQTKYEDWETSYDSGDVAVLPLHLGANFKWVAIPVEDFITKELMEEFNIWPGDEVFLIGRLITQAGRQRNTPVVRFGNISMLPDPDELIETNDYGSHEGFLIECRSISGFSGSPVFASTTQTYRPKNGSSIPWQKSQSGVPTLAAAKPKIPEITVTGGGAGTAKITNLSMSGTFGPWFLGIDWGHVTLYKPVYDGKGNPLTDYCVDANTGIAYVVPAWKILDLLNSVRLLQLRRKDDEEIQQQDPSAVQNIREWFDLDRFSEIKATEVQRLKDEIASLREAVGRRRLSDGQKEDLKQLLWARGDKGNSAKILFVDYESRLYAYDFFEVFLAAEWRVGMFDYSGPRKGSSGVIVCGLDPEGTLVNGFMEDLMSVGIKEVYRALYSEANEKELVVIVGEKEIHSN